MVMRLACFFNVLAIRGRDVTCIGNVPFTRMIEDPIAIAIQIDSIVPELTPSQFPCAFH